GEGNGLRLESVAQGLRHSLRIAKIAHETLPLLWRIRRQPLALLTVRRAKESLMQRDTFTIPRRRRKQRVVSTRKNYRHDRLACHAAAAPPVCRSSTASKRPTAARHATRST